ncbi:hypothetical protein [Cellulosimicrobium sp. Marseille-Q8652]
MENDHGGAAPRPTPAEARDALADLGADDARLADRLVTPRWYHPLLGAIVALIVCTQALPSPASVAFVPVGIFALPALVLVYRRRYGLWIGQPAGPRSKRILGTMAVLCLLCFGAAMVVKFTPVGYAWVLLPAAIGFAACVALGRRYDDAVRAELRGAVGEA